MQSVKSIFNHLTNAELTPILRGLITESSLPLKVVEADFAVDSSGFTTSPALSGGSITGMASSGSNTSGSKFIRVRPNLMPFGQEPESEQRHRRHEVLESLHLMAKGEEERHDGIMGGWKGRADESPLPLLAVYCAAFSRWKWVVLPAP
jgi:hypothetical protein